MYDFAAPTVNTFTATTPSNSLTIPITAFTASDTVGVTGYLITTIRHRTCGWRGRLDWHRSHHLYGRF